ncbi:hypothetical protein PR048_013053 [Dryococelus australis]|uniref:GAG-pre-integrase domain-containing protein n=1 Tax=Dryococelus australis TaxID=614101 RepID=A0ABQ9HR97_9NEOP|nr:hypothetical protein PR048_013053 [Dryococelus australis]
MRSKVWILLLCQISEIGGLLDQTLTIGNSTKEQEMYSNVMAVMRLAIVNLNALMGLRTEEGATTHMTREKEWFRNYRSTGTGVKTITLADNNTLQGTGYGDFVGQLNEQGDTDKIHYVLHAPQISSNLLSVSTMVSRGIVVVFSESGCKMYHRCEARLRQQQQTLVAVHTEYTLRSTRELWHKRFAHLGRVGLDQLKNVMVTGMSYSDSDSIEEPCVSCIKGKQARKPFNKCSMTRAMKRL